MSKAYTLKSQATPIAVEITSYIFGPEARVVTFVFQNKLKIE